VLAERAHRGQLAVGGDEQLRVPAHRRHDLARAAGGRGRAGRRRPRRGCGTATGGRGTRARPRCRRLRWWRGAVRRQPPPRCRRCPGRGCSRSS
jgi:hypothetical protein